MIGKTIKELRIKNSLTQKDLAEKLFVTAQAVSRWENGEVEPSISTVTDIAKIFNVTVDEIVGNPVEEKKPEVIVDKQYIYKDAVQPVLGVCETCNKPIYDATEIVRRTTGGGRSPEVSRVYCKECDDKRIERERQAKINFSKSRKTKSFVISGIVAGIWLLITILVSISQKDLSFLAGNVAFALLLFTFISCCILDNNFIGEMSLGIFSWGFVKMPGLIFSLDLDGIIWLLTVKLAFWVIGFILACITGLLAVTIGGVLSIFVYPFALAKNIKHQEDVDLREIVNIN